MRKSKLRKPSPVWTMCILTFSFVLGVTIASFQRYGVASWITRRSYVNLPDGLVKENKELGVNEINETGVLHMAKMSNENFVFSSTISTPMKMETAAQRNIDTTPHHEIKTSVKVRRWEKNTKAATKTVTAKIYRNIHENNTDVFIKVLKPDEEELLFHLIKVFDLAMKRAKITYFIAGGTLLGSFRHHDLIPWDDDVDVYVDQRQAAKIKSIMQDMQPEYALHSRSPRYKLFSNTSRSSKATLFGWKFPYIDINFYKENKTHLIDVAPISREYIFPKATVFPLHLRPFGKMWLPSPRDGYANLLATYDDVSCQRGQYRHISELNYKEFKKMKKTKDLHTDCSLLKNTFAFVHRKAVSKGVMETLKLGDDVIRSVFVEEPPYAVTNPFTLGLISQQH